MARPRNSRRQADQVAPAAAATQRSVADDTQLPAADDEGEPLDAERRQLAERLKDTREFLGLSQQEAADAAGLTRMAISTIENGRRKVESVELAALARVYGQPVSYFLPSREAEDVSQPEEVKFIARAARELAPEDRSELLRFAEFLKTYRSPRSPAEGRTAEER